MGCRRLLRLTDPPRGHESRPPRGQCMSLTDDPDFPAVALEDDVLDSLAPAFPAGDVADLRARVRGPVFVAGDDGLAAEVAAWNVAVQHTPAVAVGATCAADVVAAVTWAVAHDLR